MAVCVALDIVCPRHWELISGRVCDQDVVCLGHWELTSGRVCDRDVVCPGALGVYQWPCVCCLGCSVSRALGVTSGRV